MIKIKGLHFLVFILNVKYNIFMCDSLFNLALGRLLQTNTTSQSLKDVAMSKSLQLLQIKEEMQEDIVICWGSWMERPCLAMDKLADGNKTKQKASTTPDWIGNWSLFFFFFPTFSQE